MYFVNLLNYKTRQLILLDVLFKNMNTKDVSIHYH